MKRIYPGDCRVSVWGLWNLACFRLAGLHIFGVLPTTAPYRKTSLSTLAVRLLYETAIHSSFLNSQLPAQSAHLSLSTLRTAHACRTVVQTLPRLNMQIVPKLTTSVQTQLAITPRPKIKHSSCMLRWGSPRQASALLRLLRIPTRRNPPRWRSRGCGIEARHLCCRR